MDIETLVDVMSEEERSELLERLTTAAEHPESTTDGSGNGCGCCGGPRSMAQRRAMMTEMRNMCCGTA